MRVKALRSDLVKYLTKHSLTKKFAKQRSLFESNPRHPSLDTERLEPKHLRIYSFRIDRRYRAIFIFLGREEIEVVDINDHYHQ